MTFTPQNKFGQHIPMLLMHITKVKKKKRFPTLQCLPDGSGVEIAKISLLLWTRTLHMQIMHFLPHGSISVTTMTRESG
jgi:hypothetical protein